MRYIPLNTLVKKILMSAAGVADEKRLFRAHTAVKQKAPNDRQKYIKENGSTKWSPIKLRMTAELGNKCWYTEAELVGEDPAIDHFRPVVDYWFLAFQISNYRVACQYANSPKHNPVYGRPGGKGGQFPLLPPSIRASSRSGTKLERPVLLDPCRKSDCALLAFQADGRPILNPTFAADPLNVTRVEESKILLNLDHPAFNSKREQLYHDIRNDVTAYEELPPGSPSRSTIHGRLKGRLSSKAPFSVAARYYLGVHRHLPWVEKLLKAP